jgi:band 4.1-like protein 4A
MRASSIKVSINQTAKESWKLNQFPFLNPLTRKSQVCSTQQQITFFHHNRIDNIYRSTHSIPATFNNSNNNNNSNSNGKKYSAPDSPRSTRSAGWIKSQQRGLFGITSSPKSVRSASSRNGNANNGHRHRSSSVESQSSNDSRSGRRHRSRSKRMSDNESEMSRGSGRSGRSHRKHRRHRSRNRDSTSAEGRDYNYNSEKYEQPELIDSGKQWIEVQRKQAEKLNMGNVQQASVIKSNTAPKSNHSTDTYSRNKKHRKHR